MVSSKPYLLRAIHEWLVDSGLTPYILVDAEFEGVNVPAEYVTDGQIVLNVSPSAVKGLEITNAQMEFSARFSGQPMYVSFPMGAVKGIYARENGQGMIFEDMESELEPPNGPDSRPARKPLLKLVK